MIGVHGAFVEEGAGAFEVGHFVFAEEPFDTFGERGYDVIFGFLGLVPVDGGFFDVDAEAFEVVL